MKKALYNEQGKGYSKHKNREMSDLANSLTSLADGEINKMTLENVEEKIKLTIYEKADSEATNLFDSLDRDKFRNSLKGNTGVLPYYISEYFGNKEVPRYLTKGEAALAMTANPDLELYGVRNGKGGSTILSKEPISLAESDEYDKYKTFLLTNAKLTPSVDKILSKYTDVKGDYDEFLINESAKIYEELMNAGKKMAEEILNEDDDDIIAENDDDDEVIKAVDGKVATIDPEAFLNGDDDEDEEVDAYREVDALADNIAQSIAEKVDDNVKDKTLTDEMITDIQEVTVEALNDSEKKDASTYEEEVIASIEDAQNELQQNA